VRGGGVLTRWGSGEGHFLVADKKVGNIMASCMCGEHDFYVKITPRRKSGNAVAHASVAPVRLHRLIRHKGINTRRIRARGGGSDYIIGISAGLAQLSQDTSI